MARPETDRATTPDRLNPASDALLLNLMDKLPRDLFKMTRAAFDRWRQTGDAAPEALQTEQNNYQIGQQCPLNLKALVETLDAVMEEHPDFQPHIGPEHVWSPQSKGNLPSRALSAIKGERPFPVPIFGSKLVSALGLGATSMVLPTGQEADLKEWVMSQDDSSVQLHQLFGQAYKLHRGDLYGTLLCAENVLSEGLYTPDRKERPITRKLSYIRSDSAPEGDNFGAWYHLFGSALYSMVRPEWKADTIIKIEDWGSGLLEGDDPQEDHINQLGLELGRCLKEIAQTGLGEPSSPQAYLNTEEFGWNRCEP